MPPAFFLALDCRPKDRVTPKLYNGRRNSAMPRIRTIKPEFFRHDKLQELGPIPMLVFLGLWTQADKAGNFPWRPSQLKLDILPFIRYDVGTSLEVLRNSGFVIAYEGADGNTYGHIPNFERHQRFFGSELKAKPRFPAFIATANPQGSSLEVSRTVESGVLESGIRNSIGILSATHSRGRASRKAKNPKSEIPAPVLAVYGFWKRHFKASARKADAIKWIERRGQEHGYERLIMAVNAYRLECNEKKTEEKFWKECANFFGEDAAFEGFLPEPEIYAKHLARATAELNGGNHAEAA